MTEPLLIRHLEGKLADPLPGMKAQSLMSPVNHQNYTAVREDHKVACVSCLLYLGDEGWTTILIERQSFHPEDKHGGQLGFPGGKLEASDLDLEFCALRETEEEIGVSPGDIKILGQLSELYVYVSNFLVYPFVGYLETLPTLIPQPSEVRSILHVPLSRLVHPGTKKKKDLRVRNHVIRDVPYYNIEGKALWGATAMMMSELEHLLIDFDR